MPNVEEWVTTRTGTFGSCTLETAGIRREWYDEKLPCHSLSGLLTDVMLTNV